MRLVTLTVAGFLAIMTIGLPLPVIPLYVGHRLSFGNVLIGLSVGIQFLATIMTRSFSGRQADHLGPRRVMLRGMFFCGFSGLLLILSALLPVGLAGRLLLLITSRLVLGFGESQLVVGLMSWAIATVGHERSATALAWSGMAMYGAIAAAAPLGFWLYHQGGLAVIGAAVMIAPSLGAVLTCRVPGVAPHPGEHKPFWKVLGLVWQAGLALMLQGVGFAAIGAFISLDFAHHHWSGTGLALSCFGGAFVLVRLFCGHLPYRFGGLAVAIISMLVETMGQTTLWLAPTAWVALLGAGITGAGCSMVFPAFGFEIVKRVPAKIRATALGGFSAFQDLAYGLTGPLTGLAATSYGYPSVFAIGAVCALAGGVTASILARGGLGWAKAI